MIIPNQKQALEELKPHGYRGPNRLLSERSGPGGKIKAGAGRPRHITIAGHVSSPPTSPDFGGTGLKVMGS
jgi:hypothetical protein